MKFEKFINYFNEYLLVKNYSDRTVSNYIHQVNRFFFFIEEKYSRINQISQITKDTVADYINYLICYKDKKGKSLSKKTISVKIICARSFFKFLLKHDYILTNPMLLTELPRNERSLPRNILTEEEVKEILTGIKTNTPSGLRNKAIIELFYSTGIRTSELANLKILDLDLKQQIAVIIKGKGGKTRMVPVGQHACYFIEQYLEKARKYMLKGKITDEGYLFLTERGNKFDRSSLNQSVIKLVLRNIRINKKVTCYTFRHSIATHLIKNKVDIRYVSQLLGHASLDTTQQYVHLEISDLQKMHALYHPREQDKNINK